MSARSVGVTIFAALYLSVAGQARAEETAERKADLARAKTAFKAGQELMKMDRFADAVAEFKKAYEITEDGLVMGQIAMAYEKGGDFEAALESIKVYREALPEADRASVDELIKNYQEAIKAGRSKKLVLPSEQAAAADPADAPAAGDAEGGGRKKGRFWTWIAAGTTGAFALGALVVGLNAQSKFSDLESTCAPSCPQSEVDSVETRAATADVLWGLAAAAAVTTGVLYFLEGRGRGSAEPAGEVDKEPGEEEFEYDDEEEETRAGRRIYFAPLVGGGQYGLGAIIRY